MDKNKIATTPPMGWNSWDCFGASVTEKELLENADYMAKNLKEYGWEYIVCDIQWYEPTADSTEYHDFVPLTMDEYGRLLPSKERFPSASNGQGFRYIADYIHRLGLKFGIHIMRGVPRQAVHAATPIKNSTATARQIAKRYSVCSWNTDMYGINPNAYGAQAYYDSLFELYAQWGVDFVKVDDICNTFFKKDNPYSAKGEIELIRTAIDRCGRDIVLSLSPGPAVLSEVNHLSKHANMWRMTGDFWDDWSDLVSMFEYCNKWSPFVKEGCWPDCDMIPLGHISIRGDAHGLKDRYTRFTRNEQITLITLWCMFRSPLMFGGHLPDNDQFTNSLLQNKDLLLLLSHSYGAHQVVRNNDSIIWKSFGDDDSVYVAFFNTFSVGIHIEATFELLSLEGEYDSFNLWSKEIKQLTGDALDAYVPSHGVVINKLTRR